MGIPKESIYISIFAGLFSPGVYVLMGGHAWGFGLVAGGIVFACLALVSIKNKKDEKERRKRIAGEISELLTYGRNVCNGFYPLCYPFPDGSDDNYQPIRSFKDWRSRCRIVLKQNELEDWDALFFGDTNFAKRGATKNTYVGACNAGLARLEEFLKHLRGRE
jgi:hypothetical protein